MALSRAEIKRRKKKSLDVISGIIKAGGLSRYVGKNRTPFRSLSTETLQIAKSQAPQTGVKVEVNKELQRRAKQDRYR